MENDVFASMKSRKKTGMSAARSMRAGWHFGILFIILLIAAGQPAFAQGLGGHINLFHNSQETFEDGRKTLDAKRFSQNLVVDFTKFVTPQLSYRLYVRESLSDFESTDSLNNITTQNNRALEPALDIFLRNAMYSFSSGYKRQEQWSTATLMNESRDTSVFYYARFNVIPNALPSLTINYDRRDDFDHRSPSRTDRTTDDFSVSSSYTLPSRGIRAGYYISYSHNVDRTPLSPVVKQVSDSVNANYRVGYSGFIWDRKARYTVNYKGNYSRGKARQFVSQTGSFTAERPGLAGLYIQNNNDQVALNSLPDLVDEDTSATTGINLSTGIDHQMGIFVSSSNTVDRLFIYVTTDVSGETNLTIPSNWRVFSSNFNQLNTWSPVSISNIVVTTDISNTIFRYEIIFTAPQNASYFKAINDTTSSVLNVEVTEIEAYGTDDLTSEQIKTISTAFTQGINANVQIDPVEKLSVSLNYSLDRSDQEPESLIKSFGGVFRNIFSNSVSSGKDDFRSLISRNLGITATWLTHSLLTTTLGFQKNENFDNVGQSDFESDTYRLQFRSVPLPTLDMTLSLIESQSFSFDSKTSVNDAVLLSINAALYTGVNMITDIGYTKSKSFVSNTTTKSRSINGSLDARITKKLTGTLSYAYSRTISESDAADLLESLIILNYRPGRFINITGNLKFSDADGERTVSEGVSVDWIPLRAIRLSMSYTHSDTSPETSRTDALNGLIIWYLTRFSDLRFTYAYVHQVRDVTTEIYNYNTTFNCRF